MSSFISSDSNSFHRFLDSLALSLDVGTKSRIYHLCTPPIPTIPIFSPPPGQPDEPTTCESHFLTVSQPHVITSANVDPSQSTNDHDPGKTASHVLVLGIEVLIFSTDSLTTIFVSKADSTGFLSRPAESTQGSSSIVKLVISAFLEWLVTRELSRTASGPIDVTCHGLVARPDEFVSDGIQHQGRSGQGGSSRRRRRLVLSLFARSQNQYLFPGSIENTSKHVLDDRQLIKWWCRVLDGLVQRDRNVQTTSNDGVNLGPSRTPVKAATNLCSPNAKISTSAYVVVPGCDRTETVRSFFPPTARYSRAESEVRWHNSYPVKLLVQHDQIPGELSLPVRCSIPRLPDDPKARYCDDLDNAGIDDKGQWKDVRSLQQFWEMMEYRQECAAGRLVGFVWVVFDPFPESSQAEVTSHVEAGVTNTTNRSETVTADRFVQVQQVPDATQSSRGSTLVTNEQYITLSDLLINTTDFAGVELAVKSTCEWTDKVKELSGLQHFGVDVDGKKSNELRVPGPVTLSEHTSSTTGSKHPRDEGSTPVNVLTGCRKKKQKINTETPSTADVITTTNGHNTTTLEPEKKIGQHNDKADNTGGVGGNCVQTLSAGLVRKKPKAV